MPNEVEIVVRTVNKSREGLGAARSDVAALGKEAEKSGSAFDKLISKMGNMNKKTNFAVSPMAGLIGAGIALGPAVLAPLTAATAALGGAFAAAGLGALAFGAVVKPAMTSITKAISDQALAAKGGKAAIKQYAADLAAMSPATRTLMVQVQGLQGSWKEFQRTMQPTVLPVVAQGLALIRMQIPFLAPLVKGASLAFKGLLTDLSNASKTPFWTQLRDQVTKLSGPAITGFGKAIGNVITGVAGIFKAFLPFAPTMLSWLDKITAKFATWGQNLGGTAGFTKFMDYVKQNGPKLQELIKNLAIAIGRIVVALSTSISGNMLTVLLQLSGVLKNLSPTQIKAVAVAIVALKAALLVGGNWAGISKVLGIVGSALAALSGTALLTIGVVGLLFTKVKWFHDGTIKSLEGFPKQLRIIGQAIVDMSNWIARALTSALAWMAEQTVKILAKIVGVFKWLYDTLVGHSIIPDLINGMIRWWKHGISSISGIVSWFGRLPGMFGKWMGGAVSAIGNWLGRAVNYFQRLPGQILGALGGLASSMYNAGANIVRGLIAGLMSQWNSIIQAASNITNLISSFLPHSPAKRGPLSGSGDPMLAGKEISSRLADGINKHSSRVTNAMSGLISGGVSGAVNAGGPGTSRGFNPLGGHGHGGTQKIQLEWVGGQAGDELFKWIKKNIRVRAGSGTGNVQRALG